MESIARRKYYVTKQIPKIMSYYQKNPDVHKNSYLREWDDHIKTCTFHGPITNKQKKINKFQDQKREISLLKRDIRHMNDQLQYQTNEVSDYKKVISLRN